MIQEDVEVPYASGPNWDRKQYPSGPIIIQGDYGPIAVRNLRVNEWQADEESCEPQLAKLCKCRSAGSNRTT